MKLYILVGQRKQRYEGEYGMEALACATEYDVDGNPDYLPEQESKYRGYDEFDALTIATLDVNESELLGILRPTNTEIKATVLLNDK